MISQIETTAGKVAVPLYQLEIALIDSKPRIWRRLQVPGDATLGWLHAVIQVAMGWTNSHLHQFLLDGAYYSDPDHQDSEFDEPKILNERKFTLQQLIPSAQGPLIYEYDFGDSWHHLITVEKTLPLNPALGLKALCLAGARACPPEDCGGVWGYAELLKTLKNPKHPDHQSMKEWLGRPFNAEAFDVAKTNTWLAKLKWPRVTDAQLRKVLMGRDGYRE